MDDLPDASPTEGFRPWRTAPPAELPVAVGLDAARMELRRVLGDRYEAGLADLEDPDLVDQ